MTTAAWTNTAGGLWTAAPNWSPARVPELDYDAVVAAPGTYTVTVPSSPAFPLLAQMLTVSDTAATLAIAPGASLTLGSLTNMGTLAIGAGATLSDNASGTTAAVLASLGAGTSQGTLALGGVIDNTGATLTTGSGLLTSVALTGKLRGGIVAGSGQIAFGDISVTTKATLDGVAVRGRLLLGNTVASTYGLVLGGLTVTNPDGSAGTLEVLSPQPGTGAFRHPTELNFSGVQTWNNMNLVFDGDSSDSLLPDAPTRNGARLTLGTSTSLTVKSGQVLPASGTGITTTVSVLGVTFAGAVSVEARGQLLLEGGVEFAPTARVNLASGSRLFISEDITGTALTAMLGQVSGQIGASTYTGSGFTLTGGVVAYEGKLDNAGNTLDLTPGGLFDRLTQWTGTVGGGVLVNSSAGAADLQPGNLTGVTLRGAFRVGSAQFQQQQLGSQVPYTVLVKDGLGVLAADGGDGVLDLATYSASLRIVAPSVPGAVTTFDHMRIKLGQFSFIDAEAPLVLGPATVTDVQVSGGLFNAVTNKGTINVAATVPDGDPVTLSFGAVLGIVGPDFENDGTVNVGAGSVLAGSVINKGTINLAAGASLSADLPDTAGGTLALSGGNTVSFAGSGTETAAVVGFRAGDTVRFGSLRVDAATTLALTGQTLTILQGGAVLASLALSDPGQAAYALSDFSLTAQGAQTAVLSTTHDSATSIPSPTPTPTPTNTAAVVSAFLPTGTYSAAAIAAASKGLSALPNAGSVKTAVQADGTFVAATAGLLNVAVATASTPGGTLTMPAGYGALLAAGSSPVTLSDAGLAGAVLVGNGAGDTFNSTGAGVTLVGGQGANTFNVSGVATIATGDGSSTVRATGSAAVQVTTGTGGSTVLLAGGGGTVQSHGQDTVFGGSGTSTVTAGKGLVALGGEGRMTFIGGAATSVVFGGKGGVDYTAGSAYDIAVGGPGTLVAQGGVGGGQFWGNSGADVLRASGTTTTVLVANKGGQLFSSGTAGNFLVAGSGTVVLDGSKASGNDVFFGGTGQDTIIAGSGNDLIGTGTGTSTVQLGAGKSTVFAFGTSTVASGTGSADIVMGGTVVLNILSGAARNFALFNFVPGTDKIGLQGYSSGMVANAIATQVNGPGQTVLTLSDQTHIQLIGVAKANASFFG